MLNRYKKLRVSVGRKGGGQVKKGLLRTVGRLDGDEAAKTGRTGSVMGNSVLSEDGEVVSSSGTESHGSSSTTTMSSSSYAQASSPPPPLVDSNNSNGKKKKTQKGKEADKDRPTSPWSGLKRRTSSHNLVSAQQRRASENDTDLPVAGASADIIPDPKGLDAETTSTHDKNSFATRDRKRSSVSDILSGFKASIQSMFQNGTVDDIKAYAGIGADESETIPMLKAYELSRDLLRDRLLDDLETVTILQSLVASDILIVKGMYDAVEKIFALLGLPFTAINPDDLDSASAASHLRTARIIFVNSSLRFGASRAQKLGEWVKAGGTLVTSDYALKEIIEPVFPGLIERNGLESAADIITASPQVTIPPSAVMGGLYDDIQDASIEPVWYLEEGALQFKVLDKIAVDILIKSPELEEKASSPEDGAGPTFVRFDWEEGQVYHSLCHFYLTRSEPRDTDQTQKPSVYASLRKATPYTLSKWRVLEENGDIKDVDFGIVQSALTSAETLVRLTVQAKEAWYSRCGTSPPAIPPDVLDGSSVNTHASTPTAMSTDEDDGDDLSVQTNRAMSPKGSRGATLSPPRVKTLSDPRSLSLITNIPIISDRRPTFASNQTPLPPAPTVSISPPSINGSAVPSRAYTRPLPTRPLPNPPGVEISGSKLGSRRIVPMPPTGGAKAKGKGKKSRSRSRDKDKKTKGGSKRSAGKRSKSKSKDKSKAAAPALIDVNLPTAGGSGGNEEGAEKRRKSSGSSRRRRKSSSSKRKAGAAGNIKKVKQYFRCTYCHKVFASKPFLDAHVQRRHQEEWQKGQQLMEEVLKLNELKRKKEEALEKKRQEVSQVLGGRDPSPLVLARSPPAPNMRGVTMPVSSGPKVSFAPSPAKQREESKPSKPVPLSAVTNKTSGFKTPTSPASPPPPAQSQQSTATPTSTTPSPTTSPPAAGAIIYKCSHCGKLFKGSKFLEAHIGRRHGQPSSSSSSNTVTKEDMDRIYNETQNTIPARQDIRFKPFFKALRMGIPRAHIEIAMNEKGYDISILDHPDEIVPL